MTTRHTMRDPNGPFRSDQLRPGDRYELSDGHAIYCAPTGGSAARSTVAIAQMLDSDPAVESAGIDAGFKQNEKNLRAPDVSIGVPDAQIVGLQSANLRGTASLLPGSERCAVPPGRLGSELASLGQ